MRAILLLIYTIFLFSNLNATTISAKVNNDDSLKVNLTIKGDPKQPVYILHKNNLTDNEEILKIVSKNQKGKQEIFLPKAQAPLLYLKYAESTLPLYIDRNNNDLKVEIDITKQLPSIKFFGNGKYINQYLLEKKQVIEESDLDLKELYSMSQNDFIKFNNQVKQKINDVRKIYFKRIKDHHFKTFDSLDVDAYFLVKNIIYADYHNHFTQEKVQPISTINDIQITKFEKSEICLLSQSCVELISMYIDNKIRTDSDYKKEKDIEQQINFFFEKKLSISKTLFNNNNLSMFFLTKTLLSASNSGRTDFFNANLDHIEKNNGAHKFLDYAKERQLSLASLTKGKDAPNIQFISESGEKIDLKDFIGKTVYINVWSPGCSASVSELNNINKLSESLSDTTNYSFINIYNDNDLGELNRFLASKKLNGKNVILETPDDFKSQYFIRTTPRYIIIDKDGKILDPFAPRPSSPKIRQVLKDQH